MLRTTRLRKSGEQRGEIRFLQEAYGRHGTESNDAPPEQDYGIPIPPRPPLNPHPAVLLRQHGTHTRSRHYRGTPRIPKEERSTAKTDWKRLQLRLF